MGKRKRLKRAADAMEAAMKDMDLALESFGVSPSVYLQREREARAAYTDAAVACAEKHARKQRRTWLPQGKPIDEHGDIYEVEPSQVVEGDA